MAKEIHHKKFLIGDYVVIPDAVYDYFRVPSIVIAIDNSDTFDKLWLSVSDDNYVNADTTVWLPRQDQLQKIVDLEIPFIIYEFNKFIIDGIKKDYTTQFDSMEQLWLSFVMKEKYRKVWNDKKEIWENPEEK